MSQEKLANLRSAMTEQNIDLLALGPSSHMQWLLGFHPHADERPCLLLVTPTAETFLMPVLNAEGTRESTDISFHTWSDDTGPDAALADALNAINAIDAKQVALDETMRADFALLLLSQLPNATHSFTDATLGELRMRKDQQEYEKLKLNAGIADKAMETVFASLKVGMTELEAADIIDESFAEQGAKRLFAIVGAAKNGAFPHHQTGPTKLQAGDALVIDLGGTKEGYPSDITRAAVMGEVTEEYLKVHAIVDAAVNAALEVIRPGVIAKDVDAAARQVITDAGYGEYFVHRTGHGLGLEIHEPPYITSTSESVLDEGMVFSVEPGIYLPGKFGIRLEEIVIVRKDGPEILSELPRYPRIIG